MDILVNKTIFSTLVRYQLVNGGIQVVPDLAQSWTANASLTEYTFKLRSGVKWHDGQPLTADDVKFTLDAQLNPKVNAGLSGVVAAIKETQVVDPLTVKFVTQYPYASLPVMLGYNIAIVPKHLLQSQDLNQPVAFIQHPVGTGPFKFKSFTQDTAMEVEANPDYWGGAPMLDGIVFKVIPDGNARLAQLKSGDIDFTVIDPPQLAALQGVSGITVRRAPQVDYYFFAINHDLPKFADLRVRQALTYAIDKQAIVKNILKGDGRPATGPDQPAPGRVLQPERRHVPVQHGQSGGPARRGGMEEGPGRHSSQRAGAEVHALDERAEGLPRDGAGADVRASSSTRRSGSTRRWRSWTGRCTSTRTVKRQYELLMEWWITPPDPDEYDHYYSASADNYWGYKNTALDSLLIKARSEPDLQKRVALYHQIQDLIAKDIPLVYLYYPPELQAMSSRTQGLPLIGYRDALTWTSKVWLELR